MIQTLNRILNLKHDEWPRVARAWLLIFLTRFGFIVGWSVLIAGFLSHIGIEKLPFLFLLNAILIMLGTLVYRPIVHRIRKELLIALTALVAAAFLLSSIFFVYSNVSVFFTLLIFTEAVLVSQVGILLSLFNEELFTPLESQRTFPIIESAETLGGLIGGLTLSILAHSIPSYKFILMWTLSLILILPIVLKFNGKRDLKPHSSLKKRASLTERFYEIKKTPFLKTLLLIIALHWAMMNVIEFQYTKAVQQDVYSIQEETLVLNDNPYGVVLSSDGEVHQDGNHYFEQEITQKLGFLHMIFNSAALLLQLVLASRILSRLGIVSTLLLHPAITLLNLVDMTFKFSFFTTALTRGSYELTGLLFKNAYDASYYSIPHEDRSDIKEIMQGIVKPLGAIFGTGIILGLSLALDGTALTLSLNVFLIAMVLFMMTHMRHMKGHFTQLTERNISRKKDLSTRLNSIEMLALEGHSKFTEALHKILLRDEESLELKLATLKTLGERRDPSSVPSLVAALSANEIQIRRTAAQALTHYDNKVLPPFSKDQFLLSLEERLMSERDKPTQESLVKTYININESRFVHFIKAKIKTERGLKRAQAISCLRSFEDPELITLLEKHLEDRSSYVRSACIEVLWSFEAQRNRLEHYLKQMLESEKIPSLKASIETCGNLKLEWAGSKIESFTQHEHREIKETALRALAKIHWQEEMSPLPSHYAHQAKMKFNLTPLKA